MGNTYLIGGRSRRGSLQKCCLARIVSVEDKSEQWREVCSRHKHLHKRKSEALTEVVCFGEHVLVYLALCWNL